MERKAISEIQNFCSYKFYKGKMAKDVFHFSNEYGIHGCRGTVYSTKEKIETETDTKTKLKTKTKTKTKQS